MTLALIDADIICYQAAAVAEQAIDWGDDDGVFTHLDERKACEVADDLVNQWTGAAKGKRKLLILGGTSEEHPSFRQTIWPDYKMHRKDAKRPLLVATVRAHLEAKYRCKRIPGLEADDVLGLIATGPDGKKYTVVSIDKDMLTLPARVVNPTKGDPPVLLRLKVADADYNWMYQTLVGDSADNYPGCPGIGPKGADVLLSVPGARNLLDWWPIVLDTFCSQSKNKRWKDKFPQCRPEDFALIMAQCARILRHGDWDHTERRVRLWIPNLEEAAWLTV